MSFMKISQEKAVLFLWAQMKLHLRVYPNPVWHFESKECLGVVCVLHHGGCHLQSCINALCLGL
jgi:hypothetical protein